MMREETEKKYEEICRLFREGKTREQIAEATYYSKPSVDRILKQYGNMQEKERFQDHKEEALMLYGQGLTLAAIAEKTGLSVSTINRNLKRLGKGRGRGGRRRASVPPQELAEQKREKVGSAGRADRSRKAAGKTEGQDPVPVQCAENTRRTRKVVIRGKAYQDVTAWYM